MSRPQPGCTRSTIRHRGPCPGIQLPPGLRSAQRSHVCCLKVHDHFPQRQLASLSWHLQRERGRKGEPSREAWRIRERPSRLRCAGSTGSACGREGGWGAELSLFRGHPALSQGRWAGLAVRSREWCTGVALVHEELMLPLPWGGVGAPTRPSHKISQKPLHPGVAGD